MIYRLDGLQAAYVDTRFTVDSLRQSIPDLAEDSPGIDKGLKDLRESVYKFSNTIKHYQEFVFLLAEHLTERSKILKTALSKAKPQTRWNETYNSNSESGREIAQLWLAFFDGLKQEVKSVWEKTYEAQLEIFKACQDRRYFQFELEEAEREMTKTNEKQGDATFNFKKAYQVRQRIGGKPGDPGGYEKQLWDLAENTHRDLRFCNNQLIYSIEKLHQLLGQANYETKLIEVPKLGQQIEVIDTEIRDLTSQIEWVNSTTSRNINTQQTYPQTLERILEIISIYQILKTLLSFL